MNRKWIQNDLYIYKNSIFLRKSQFRPIFLQKGLDFSQICGMIDLALKRKECQKDILKRFSYRKTGGIL